MCGEKLASDIHRLTEQFVSNFDNYAKEVSRTKHLMKRYKPKPVVISQKQKDQVEDLKNFTKAQLTKKIEQYEMEDPETSQKECKKGEKIWND